MFHWLNEIATYLDFYVLYYEVALSDPDGNPRVVVIVQLHEAVMEGQQVRRLGIRTRYHVPGLSALEERPESG